MNRLAQVTAKFVAIRFLPLGVCVALFGCNDSGFSGNSAPQKTQEVMSAKPNDSADGKANKPGKPLGNPTDTESATDFGDFFDGLNDNDVSDFDPDLALEDNSVTFGANEIFHLGDGSFDGSSCRFTVDTYDLSGTRYFFEFDVEENNTAVAIRINRICGVDYGDTNFAVLYENGQQLEKIQIPTGAFMLGFNTTMVNAGRYRIEVHSTTGALLDKTPGKTDADDFIIGDLSIRGSKRISRGQFGAN